MHIRRCPGVHQLLIRFRGELVISSGGDGDDAGVEMNSNNNEQ